MKSIKITDYKRGRLLKNKVVRNQGNIIQWMFLLIVILIVAITIIFDQRSDLCELQSVEVVEASEPEPEVIKLPNQADEGLKEFGKVTDDRTERIREYFKEYGSPYPDVAETIVEESDRHGVDPYMIAAIFCQESSCGKACIAGNCTGYGVTDSGSVGKTSYPDVYTGMAGMIERYATEWGGYYKNCQSNVRCVAAKYNPRESWIGNVSWFYGEIAR